MRMLSAFNIRSSAAGVGSNRTSTTRSFTPLTVLFFNRTSKLSKKEPPAHMVVQGAND